MVDTMYSQIFVAGEANDQRKSEFFDNQGGMVSDRQGSGSGGHGHGEDTPLEDYTFLGSGALVLAGFAVLYFLIAKRKKKGSSEPKWLGFLSLSVCFSSFGWP